MNPLSIVEIEPRAEHRHSIIWLHGLGADGHDFESIVPELRLQAEPHIHFVFPDAPFRPITINGGMTMRAWFDILELSRHLRVDIAGLYASCRLVGQLIEAEIARGIPADQIMLAGFSQGGAVALQAGLSYSRRLAGIVALSTFLPTLTQLESERSAANRDLPIFIGHGILDSVVAVEYGKQTSDRLQAWGYPVEWHDYMMDHSVCREEIERLAGFINGIFR
ncbi:MULTISPECIES: alpha/beta hydrolase [Methylomicrobium]|uniref:Putative esterase n=1 Tax=Methylomicrobium album BG8 TaxID=686340 RepID=H8GLV0_METAL|nr:MULTISPECIES: alpha/beta fold hydrolase [Methylomicrobium]EIC28146.1 putative esterase [Methylomicrobium album BG8]